MENSDQPSQPSTPPHEEASDFSAYLSQKSQENKKPAREKSDFKNSFSVFFKEHPLMIAGFAVVSVFFIALFLFMYLLSGNDTMKLPPGAKIINEPGMPPRLQTPIFPQK